MNLRDSPAQNLCCREVVPSCALQLPEALLKLARGATESSHSCTNNFLQGETDSAALLLFSPAGSAGRSGEPSRWTSTWSQQSCLGLGWVGLKQCFGKVKSKQESVLAYRWQPGDQRPLQVARIRIPGYLSSKELAQECSGNSGHGGGREALFLLQLLLWANELQPQGNEAPASMVPLSSPLPHCCEFQAEDAPRQEALLSLSPSLLLEAAQL